MRNFAWFALALAPIGCSTPASEETESNKSSVSHQFFENSKRRDANALEAPRVAHVGTGCTAFFLENTAGKVYMASARHCFEFSVTSWCANDGTLTDNDGVDFKCTKVIAADKTHDIAVFEVDHPSHASKGTTTLRLASFNPPAKQRLIMTGYPCDQDPVLGGRNCMLTTTENCWTMGTPVESPYAQQDTNTLDEAFKHNCTTYGGNSGGPMFAEGTRDVVGLPFTYLPDDYNRYSSTDLTTAAHLALMSDFVSVHQSELAAAGITMSTQFTMDGFSEDAPEPAPTTTPEEAPAETTEEAPATTPGDADTTSPTKEDKPKKSKTSKKKTSSDDEDDSTDEGTAPVASAGCSATGAHGSAAGNGWLAAALAVGMVFAARRRRS